MKLAAGIREIVESKGVAEDVVVDVVKEVLNNSYKEMFGAETTIIDFDLHKDKLKVSIPRKIVKKVKDPRNEISEKEALAILGKKELPKDTEEVNVPCNPSKDFTPSETIRISEAILNKIKGHERSALHSEFSSKKKAEIVSGTIIKVSAEGDIFVDLGKTIATLPLSEQSPLEHYENGDNIKAVVISVDSFATNPKTGRKTKKLQVTLSRKTPNLINELLHLEIPEIQDKTIEVKGLVRLAGYKTKILVDTFSSIDPVGACVGPHGIRILAIIKEIGGEKIDIIRYSSDIKELIQASLSPAKVDRIIIPNQDERMAYAVVHNDQLPYAFGKQKQNVILVSKLCNYKVQVITEADIEELNIQEESVQELNDIFGTTLSILNLEESLLQKIQHNNIFSVEQLAEVHVENTYDQIENLSEEEIKTLKASILENIEIEEDTNSETQETQETDDEGTALDILPDMKAEWISALEENSVHSIEDLVNAIHENTLSSMTQLSEESREEIIKIINDNIEIEE